MDFDEQRQLRLAYAITGVLLVGMIFLPIYYIWPFMHWNLYSSIGSASTDTYTTYRVQVGTSPPTNMYSYDFFTSDDYSSTQERMRLILDLIAETPNDQIGRPRRIVFNVLRSRGFAAEAITLQQCTITQNRNRFGLASSSESCEDFKVLADGDRQ